MLNEIGTVIFIVLCVINVVGGLFICCCEIQELSELRGIRFADYFFKIIHWLITLSIITLGSFVLSKIIGDIIENVIKK